MLALTLVLPAAGLALLLCMERLERWLDRNAATRAAEAPETHAPHGTLGLPAGTQRLRAHAYRRPSTSRSPAVPPLARRMTTGHRLKR